MTIRLSQVAPWNRSLTNPYRTRYAEHGGRYFRIEADRLDGFWFVEEITADGVDLPSDMHIAMCRNLSAARQAIADYVGGMSREETFRKALSAPGAGTGRNHPKNVERRRGCW